LIAPTQARYSALLTTSRAWQPLDNKMSCYVINS